MTSPRVDTASKIIAASPEAIYQAFIDRDALLQWLPPEGMTAEEVPEGISKEDRDAGLKSSLENLAAYVTGRYGAKPWYLVCPTHGVTPAKAGAHPEIFRVVTTRRSPHRRDHASPDFLLR